jgi:hypothetical protein
MELQALPTGTDVARFLGRAEEARLVAMAADHVKVVAAFARGYTRGRGFDVDGAECAPDLAAVIIAATARLVTNPSQVERENVDGYETVGSFAGWTLPEVFVLHQYRRRTA